MADERTFTVNPRSTKRMRTIMPHHHHHRPDDGVNDHAVMPTRENTTTTTTTNKNTDDVIAVTNILQIVATDTESPNEVVVSKVVFEIYDLLRYVFEFVGPHQYLFVATIHPIFRCIYTKQFGFLTQCNVSTMDHAEMCVNTGHLPQHCYLPLWNLAIRYNRLRVLYHLRYLYRYDFSNLKEESFQMAVSYGHLEILQWLISISGTDDEVICTIAAQKGHVHILQFLYQSTIPNIRPWPWTKKISYSAASHGQWSTLQWLLEQGCPYCADTLRIIRQHRHLEYQVQELFLWCLMHRLIDDDNDASIASSSIHSSSEMNDVYRVPANNNNNNNNNDDDDKNNDMMDHGIQLLLPPPEPDRHEEIVYMDDDIWRIVDDYDDDDDDDAVEDQDVEITNDMIYPNDSAIYIKEMDHIPELDFPFLFISHHRES